MPRFFFHVYNGHGDTPDDTGTDLASQADARRLAVESIRSMVAEDARRGVIDLHGRIEMADAARSVLDTVAFADAFVLRLPPDESAP